MKLLPALGLALLLATTADAQRGLSAERPGDGRLVCGLGKDFHAGRRALLMERVGDELMVFRGMPDVRENLAFRQDKTFWYLTGVESPNAALVVDGKTGAEILLLPERTRRLATMEGWEGEKWDASDEWVPELTGFEDVRKTDELLDVLEELLDGRERIGISLHPPIVLAGSYDTAGPHLEAQKSDPWDGRGSRAEALGERLGEKLGVETFDVAPTIVEMRRVKTAEELAALERAGRAGALAMAEAMRSTRPGIGEWELDSLMSWMQIREGATGKAYNAIVGSGVRACILHYHGNNVVMEDGEVVLIDFGPEVDHYVTDITRAWPVGGTFSKRQREVYEAVLAAQKAGIEAAKPGQTMRGITQICNEVMLEHGFERSWIRHGACHYVGMEVHDPGAYDAPFEPGVVFTIEPGLYDEEEAIGVRIEDVVVITEDGCRVITGLVPKEADEVEALVQSEGVLDLVDSRSE
jgi:Xaa-Pro aminopeptidase